MKYLYEVSDGGGEALTLESPPGWELIPPRTIEAENGSIFELTDEVEEN